MKKLITLVTLFTFLLVFSAASFAETSADSASFKGKFTGSFEELNKLRAECKDLWSQIKSANQSVKTEWAGIKEELKAADDKAEAKKLLAGLKAKVDPLRAQVKAIHTDIKTLRDQKKSEWEDFRAAVKARDEAKASAALNNIISLKVRIIEKQKELLPLKQQILDALKNM